MKVREEIETGIADPAVLLRIFERLGFAVAFEYEKYREELSLNGAIVAIDETPIGAFIEIEGTEAGIAAAAAALGRSADSFVRDSYRTLYLRDCERRGVTPGNMVFAHA
jgi:adenylate cyclase class 2